MKFSTLAITTLLITQVISPAQALTHCWFAEGSIYCWDDNNAWRDRYDEREYSPRWLSQNHFYDDINQLYREVLGREVDPSGLTTFTKKMRQGKSLKWVRAQLARSPEAQSAVNWVYQEVLGRNVDPSGLKTYTKRLRTGWTIQEVRQDVAESEEASNRKRFISQLSRV